MKTWVPNRKIVAVAVSGIVSLLGFMLLREEMDPTLQTAIVGAVMTLIGYLVPLPADEAAAAHRSATES